MSTQERILERHEEYRVFSWRPKFSTRILITLIITLHVSLCFWGAWKHSPTIDEPAYLASGISHWEYGRFDLCRVSPPLVRLVAAIPVRLAKPKLDWKNYRIGPGVRAEHSVGRDFLIANKERSFWLFTLGRWGCIGFSLIGAWVSYRWANELFGIRSAFAALLLWCFSPNILAHAQLLTPDIGVTALSLAACYAFWRWSQSPTWLQVSIAGCLLGLAVTAKTNAIALYPALIVGIFIHALTLKQLKTFKTVGQVFIAFALSIYMINLVYGFEGSFRPLGKYEFFSSTFGAEETNNRFQGTLLEAIPVPLPAAFLEGVDLQRRDFENSHGNMKTYLRGKWYDHGWWWYYFYVIAVKVPVGTWILALIGIGGIAFRASPHRIEILCYLIIPGAMLFALACSQTGFGHSLRYVLPAFPFAFVVGSAAMQITSNRWQYYSSRTAMIWLLVSSLYVYPHSLSYFNEVAGGSSNGHFHLLDGNVDWGQDLLYIRDWIKNHPEARPVYVAYWGNLPLKQMGIDFKEPQLEEGKPIPPGWYLVSVNHLRGEYRLGKSEFKQIYTQSKNGSISCSTWIFIQK